MGTIGSRLKEFREYLKLSQEEFAEKCNVTQGNITQWETGTVKPARKLSNIINACPQLNIDWLINGNGKMLLSKDEPTPIYNILREANGDYSSQAKSQDRFYSLMDKFMEQVDKYQKCIDENNFLKQRIRDLEQKPTSEERSS